MTSQGTAHGRFTRAFQTRNLWAAEMAMREMRTVSLVDALDYLELLAAQRPDRFDRRRAVAWTARGRSVDTLPRRVTVGACRSREHEGGRHSNHQCPAGASAARESDANATHWLTSSIKIVQPYRTSCLLRFASPDPSS
jgi:hypothetical protein